MERNNNDITLVENSLDFFDTLVVRIPSFPIDRIFEESVDFNDMLNDEYFMKALLHANCEVYEEAKLWQKGNLTNAKREKKLKKTLFNYWQRIHFKTVPYGYYSSVMDVKWGDKSSVVVDGNKVIAKLDMEIVQKLYNRIMEDDDIVFNVKYYPNNTIYNVNEKIRFNEISFFNNKIDYKISSVDQNYFLAKVLDNAKQGMTVSEIVEAIADDSYSSEDFKDFVLSTIQMQVLIPEFMINITGPEPLDHVLHYLQMLNVQLNQKLDNWIEIILDIKSRLKAIGDAKNDYEKSINDLNTFLLNFIEVSDKNKIVQIDMFAETKVGSLSKNHADNIKNGVKILSAFTSKAVVTNLEEFRKKFYAKYEDALVPVMEAIDTDCGVSYGNYMVKEPNLFLNDIHVELPSDPPVNKPLKENGDILFRKYIEAFKNDDFVVEITDEDMHSMVTSEKDMALTVQVVMNCVNAVEGVFTILTAGNSTGANLISRFGNENVEIRNLLHELAAYEQGKFANAIVAEIVHIPAYRTGNITFRPCFRDYEIPVYINSVKEREFQLAIDDLYLAIREGRLILVSKKHRCEIIPRLTNAHNYGKETLPIYQLLSDLSYQSILPSVQMEIHDIDRLYNFTPRFQYKNIILLKASWKISGKEIKTLSLDLSKEAIISFRQTYKLPEYNTYRIFEADNFLNWNSLQSIQNFIEYTIEFETVYLFEFLFDRENALVHDTQGRVYQNEIIAVIKNNAKTVRSYNVPEYYTFVDLPRYMKPFDEWIYFKFYIDYYQTSDTMQFLDHVLQDSAVREEMDLYHFLPFSDPNFHIRLRIKLKGNHKDVTFRVVDILNEYGFVREFSIETYKRELERYGFATIHLAEQMFYIDSRFILSIYPLLNESVAFYKPMLAMRTIDLWLTKFEFDIADKMQFFEWVKTGYNREFDVVKGNELYLSITKSLIDQRKTIESFLDVESLNLPMLDEEELSKYNTAESMFSNALGKVYLENLNSMESKVFKFDFVQSLLHMHCIRWFHIKPRLNELFVYNGLYNYYKNSFFKQNMNKKLVK